MRALILFVTALCFSALASAHGANLWTNVNAGMSVAELVKTRPGVRDGTSEENKLALGVCKKREDGIKVGGLIFQACYEFKDGGVSGIFMTAHSPTEYDSQELRQRLAAKYGAPAISRVDNVLGELQESWKAPNGTKVTFKLWDAGEPQIWFTKLNYEVLPEDI